MLLHHCSPMSSTHPKPDQSEKAHLRQNIFPVKRSFHRLAKIDLERLSQNHMVTYTYCNRGPFNQNNTENPKQNNVRTRGQKEIYTLMYLPLLIHLQPICR